MNEWCFFEREDVLSKPFPAGIWHRNPDGFTEVTEVGEVVDGIRALKPQLANPDMDTCSMLSRVSEDYLMEWLKDLPRGTPNPTQKISVVPGAMPAQDTINGTIVALGVYEGDIQEGGEVIEWNNTRLDTKRVPETKS